MDVCVVCCVVFLFLFLLSSVFSLCSLCFNCVCLHLVVVSLCQAVSDDAAMREYEYCVMYNTTVQVYGALD